MTHPRPLPPPRRPIRPVQLAIGLALAGLGGSELRATAPAPATAQAQNDIEGRLNLGAKLTDRGEYASAEIAYRQILQADEATLAETKSALLGLARMHRREGKFTKAAAIYEKYLKEYPGDDRTPDALLDLGRTLRAMGAYKLAIARFYSVINSTLKVPSEGFDHYQLLAKTAQFEIAETHFQSGNFAEASKFYSRLRLLDLAAADRARAHFKSAFSLKLSGDLNGAVASLKEYLDQWPDDENGPEARYLLAVSLHALKRPQEAFAVTLDLLRAEKARMQADPRRWFYWQRRTGNQLANDFFESGDILNAHGIYTGLLGLSEEPSWRLPILYQIALCQERLSLTDRARQSYQTIVDSAGPNPAPAIAELARMAKWRLGHLDWRETTEHQVIAFFTPAVTPPSTPPAVALQTASLP